MFERYDEPARRVIYFGCEEAGAFGAAEIGAEHLQLGLLRQNQPLLDRLAGAPIDVEAVRQPIRDRACAGEPLPTNVDIPLSVAAKRVFERTFDEANGLTHKQIGPEHMLLGLLLEETSFAAEILRGLGLSVEKVREDLARRPSDV
jgi:ATP-dependent Clp protease ATP-binding subunit ClpC